jgi:predicted signal transduction protein with EAL and GGDEF domain
MLTDLTDVGHWSIEDAASQSRHWGCGSPSTTLEPGTPLAHLKRFPVDALKVDRSFIREILSNTEDRGIAEAIIGDG